MKKLLFMGLFGFLGFGCSTSKKIEALKPEPSSQTPFVFENETSHINIPLEINISDINTLVNSSLNGLIYNDSILDDDKSEMKIWKTAPIKLIEKNGKIQSVLPLKIWTKVKYGTDFLGLNDTKEFNLKGTLTLESDVMLQNWKLKAQSALTNFDWDESPTVRVAGKDVSITYLVNPTVSLFKKKITKKIDDSIEKSCDFKPQILSILAQLSTPINTSETYETWFKMVPLELFTTDAELKKDKILMNLSLKSVLQTMVGAKPKNTFDPEKVVLKQASKVPNEFQMSVAAVSTYESASRILTKNFQNFTFEAKGKKITVQKVDLWHKDAKVVIALLVSGSINGTIYLTGVPKYEATTKEIYFDEVNYVLDTKNVLLKSANWLASGLILTKIKEKCRYSIVENLTEGRKNLEPYFKNYSPMKGVFVNGELKSFEFEKLSIQNQGIIAFIKAQGSMNIQIKGL